MKGNTAIERKKEYEKSWNESEYYSFEYAFGS